MPEGGSAGDWIKPPFSGEIYNDKDGMDYIFGRGSIDDKQSVIGIMESLKYMIEQKQQPNRSFYVAFGHDEEVGGNGGAAHIAKRLETFLKEREEQLSFILDEGMFVMSDVFPGVSQPVAYVGVVEKGWAMVNMSVHGLQTHSSVPPKETTIGILAHAIANLEDKQQPSRFGLSVEHDTFTHVAPFANFGYKLILGNMWLFNPLVSRVSGLESTPAHNPKIDACFRYCPKMQRLMPFREQLRLWP